MKQKLLSLIALAGAMFMSTSAWAWDEPAKPVAPTTYPTMPQYEGTWVTPHDDGIYYIYNVGTGQFLGCGQDWGTRAITTLEALTTPDGETWSCGTNKNAIIPFHFVIPSDYEGNPEMSAYWMIKNYNTSNSTDNPYLVHEGNGAWIDGWIREGNDRLNNDNNGYWNLSKVGDNDYEMIPLDGQEGNTIVFGVHLTNLLKVHTAYTWCDLENNESAAAKWRFVSADDYESIQNYINDVNADPTYLNSYNSFQEDIKAYNAAMDLYNAKLALYNTLLDAEKYGADATEAGIVYTNPDATIEDVNKANEDLKAAIAPKAIEYGCKNSSEENPFEVTNYVMTNADFSAACDNGKTPPGWTVTITGNNVGQQNRTDTNADTGLSITNFLEAWTPQPGTLGNGYAGQWVKGLPAGRYRLSMDASACQQSEQIPLDELTGVYLFAGTGSYNIYDEEAPLQTEGYKPIHVEWDFDFDADSLIVGLLVDNTNCNWISADNFRLFAIGAIKEDPVAIGLKNAIAEAEMLSEKMGGANDISDPGELMNVGATTRIAFNQALEDAQAALTGTTSEQKKAAIKALDDATAAAKASAEAYKGYKQAYEKAMSWGDQLKNLNQWADLMNNLYDFAETIYDNFNEGILNEAEVAEVMAKPDKMVEDFVGDGTGIKAGDDLTLLVKNADFSEGSGRDLKGDQVPGWTITEGQLTELSGTFHNIERYHGPVAIQQTIKNLPVGTYRVGVQGFVRVDGWTDNGLPSGTENDMVLFGGVSQKRFMRIDEEYSETQIFADPTNPENTGWPYDTQRSDGLGYQPNSMEGAGKYFEETNPMTGKPFYQNEVDIVHAGGDLTIGVKCGNVGNLWILWDNFTLTYVSKSAILALIEEIKEQNEILTQTLDETGNFTLETMQRVEALDQKIANVDNLESDEEALALLQEIRDLTEQAKVDNAKILEISTLIDQYNLMVEQENITDVTYLTILGQANDKLQNNEFQNVAEIDGYITKLEGGWVAAVMAGKQAGDEVTAVIMNADFELENANFWEVNITGGNQGFQNNTTYSNTVEIEGEETYLEVSNFVEAWRDGAILNDGDISQTIKTALPEGYYRLEVDGYATNQSGIPAEGVQGVYLYAKSAKGVTQKTSMGIAVNEGKPERFSVSFYSNGQDLTTVGLLVEGANCNWVAADNFKLFFLGAEAPDAVQSLADANAKATQFFSLDGRQMSRLSRGMNIVRMSDGTYRKVMVK